MKLRIIHKGLLLLLLPLALESIIFSWLYWLNHRAEETAVKERYRTLFLAKINLMMEDSGVAWFSIANQMSSPTAKTPKFFTLDSAQYLQKTEKELDEIRAIPLRSPRLELILNKIKNLRDIEVTALEVLDRNRENFGDIDKMRAMIDHYRVLRRTLTEERDKTAELKALVRQEHQAMDAVLLQESKDRENVKILLLVGIAIQLMLTAGLLVAFLKDISNRVDVLLKNARAIPSGAPMDEAMKGSDEIAYLDEVLHEASARLAEASQNRQSIMDMIAHDIRSPLMTSRLVADKLTDVIKGAGLDASLPLTARLRRMLLQLNLLVDDLLVVEKLEHGSLELNLDLADLKAVVDEAIETARPQAEKREVTLINKMPDMEMEVVFDSLRIMQVLNNLLSNAVKFAPEKSSIEVFSKLEKDCVTVSVSDKGPGIKAQDISRIFDKFFQSGDGQSHKGFGLGLSICKMIVESHGGDIGVDSTPGSGSTFWFSLPVDE